MKNKQYELTTIADIYEQLDSEQIKRCLTELATSLSVIKAMSEMVQVVGETAGISELPELHTPLVWVDDDKNETTATYQADSKDQFALLLNKK